MNFKINEFVPDAKVVSIYTYEVCDSNGKTLTNPTFDFLQNLNQLSPQDAQILQSQILNTANVYGIGGRDESCSGRDALYALPSKYEDREKITSRYRIYFWVLNGNTIIIGGGCLKPEEINGVQIKRYQDVPDCEDAAEELCNVSKHIETLEKEGLLINEIEEEEILEL
jgi:hypothetical protein